MRVTSRIPAGVNETYGPNRELDGGVPVNDDLGQQAGKLISSRVIEDGKAIELVMDIWAACDEW